MSEELLQTLEDLIAHQHDPPTTALDVLLNLGVPSTSIALLSPDGISSKIISNHPMNKDTLFQACSISKSIASVAVFRAVQAGHLSLTAPITEYLSPEQLSYLETPQTKSLLPSITLDMLLSHTSGLSVHGFGGYLQDPPPVSKILQGTFPSNTPQVRLEGLPGHHWSYSGGGFTVVQMILETVLQKPFPILMQELVFNPLGMRRSHFNLDPDTENYARAYLTGQTPSPAPYHHFPEFAAAGLWTTPSELLLVIRALQASLAGTNTAFLTQTQARIMLTATTSHYARGWAAPAGGGYFSHSGSNDPGYRCILLGWGDTQGDGSVELGTAEGCGVCVMTNSALGFEVAVKVVLAVAYMRGWPTPELLRAKLVGSAVPFRALKERGEWRGWEGRWGEWEVCGAEGPMLRFGGLPAVRLRVAAVGAKGCREGESVDFVVDGLEMMVRFGWEEGRRIVEIRPGRDGEGDVLKRD